LQSVISEKPQSLEFDETLHGSINSLIQINRELSRSDRLWESAFMPIPLAVNLEDQVLIA